MAVPNPKPSTKKRPWRLFVGLVSVLAIGGLAMAKRLEPTSVMVAPVLRGTAVEAVYATGTVEARERVTVKARVVGTITSMKVREGDTVKVGDLLAVIDAPSLRFDLARGQADSWAASRQAGTDAPQLAAIDAQARAIEARLVSARSERDRAARLVASGSEGAALLERADAEVHTLEAQLAAQNAQRRASQIELGARAAGASAAVGSLSARVADAEVRAPLDGVVLARFVELGEVVSVNQGLLRVGNTAGLILECPVDEADLGRIAVGRKAAVSLYAFAGRTFRGEVTEIFPDADRAKKSFLTRVSLADAPVGLRSGMSAEVNIIVAERAGALLGRTEAVDTSGMAWVVKDGRVERRSLKTGVRDMLKVEILEGVSEGEELVLSGADSLTAGARVTTSLAKPEAELPGPKRAQLGL